MAKEGKPRAPGINPGRATHLQIQNRNLLPMLHLAAETLEETRGVLLAAEPKGDTRRERKGEDDRENNIAEKADINIYLLERRHETEDDDDPPGDKTNELRRVGLETHDGGAHDAPQKVGDERREEDDEQRRNEVLYRAENPLQECRKGDEAEDLGDRERARDHDEPVGKLAEENAAIELETGALDIRLKAELAEKRVNMEKTEELLDENSERPRDDEKDDEREETGEERRKEEKDRPHEIRERIDESSKPRRKRCVHKSSMSICVVYLSTTVRFDLWE